MTTVFIPQLDDLAEALRNASTASGGGTQGGSTATRPEGVAGETGGVSAPHGFAFAAPEAVDSVVELADRAMNTVELDGSPVSFAFPEAGGRARDFLLKIRASAATDFSLPDGVVWESDDPDVFDPLGDGETVVLFFTETERDVFMVARKTVQTVTT